MGFPIEIVGEGIDWPAWTQAAMSVVAIVAGFVALGIQRRQQNADAAKAREQQLYDIGNARAEFIALARGLAQQALELSQEAEKEAAASTYRIATWNFDDVITSMRSMPLDRMPSAEFALAYVNVSRALEAYKSAYAPCQEAVLAGAPPPVEAVAAAVKVQEQLALQFKRLDDEATAQGVDFKSHDTDTHEEIRRAKAGF